MTTLTDKETRFLKALKKSLLSTQNIDNASILNVSLGLRPGTLRHDHEIYGVFKQLYDSGKTIIVAAGNFGPLPGTLNPLAICPWVISVGAASIDGKKLADFSSRGIPGHPTFKPTIVAQGIDVSVPIDDLRKSHPNAPEKFTISGTSFATAAVSGLVIWLCQVIQQYGSSPSPELIKEILCDMAVPMPGYADYEVGAGFVDKEIAEKYALLKLAPSLAGPGVYILTRDENHELPETIMINYPDFYED